MPESFKSIEFVEGNCVAVGAVKQINFPDGGSFKYVKHRIDELYVENFYCKYTTTEGDALGDMVQCCVHEGKMVASESRTVCTMTDHYHPKGDAVVDEGKCKYVQIKMKGMFKKVEEYLLANPDVYA